MEKIRLKATKVIFEKDDFAIMTTDNGIKIKGNVLQKASSLIGNEVDFVGEWVETTKYGKIFDFKSYETKTDNVYFFLSNMVKGVGAKLALQIVQHFKESTASIIENSPSRLLEISGIKEKKLKNIVDSWTKYKHLKQLSDYLSPYGVTNNMVSRIYSNWGEASISKLEKNPYMLTKIGGIGFKKADEVARKIGFSENSKERIEACILFVFEKYMSDSGHSIISNLSAYKSFVDEIGFDGSTWEPNKEEYMNSINDLIMKEDLIPYDGGMLTTSKYNTMETYVYNKLRLGATISGPVLQEDLNAFLKDSPITLGQKQREAVEIANINPRVLGIAGYAGSGKTTSARFILGLYESKYGKNSIVCCALSGVAANRIKNQSGYNAMTIHSLLGVSGPGKFDYNETNPLPHKVILLDEASMVDTEMFYHLIRAIDQQNTSLIMLGDPGQLLPVGAGNVFADVLEHKLIPSVTLDVIYRQDEKQGIAVIANEIREGKSPKVKDFQFQDLHFKEYAIENKWKLKKVLPASEYDALKNEVTRNILNYTIASARKIGTLMQTMTEDLERITYFQVLSPMKDGHLGVKNLNNVVQSEINPQDPTKKEIKIYDKVFREGDKVIHLKNKNMPMIHESDLQGYFRHHDDDMLGEKRVFNGQIGILKSIEEEEDNVFVYYPLEKYYAVYAKKDLTDGVLDLAYSISVHKAQGSEYTNVLMPITTSHYVMLNAKLMYTAMTRAKSKLVMVGDPDALAMACKNKESIKRNTIIGVLSEARESLFIERSEHEEVLDRGARVKPVL